MSYRWLVSLTVEGTAVALGAEFALVFSSKSNAVCAPAAIERSSADTCSTVHAYLHCKAAALSHGHEGADLRLMTGVI